MNHDFSSENMTLYSSRKESFSSFDSYSGFNILLIKSRLLSVIIENIVTMTEKITIFLLEYHRVINIGLIMLASILFLDAARNMATILIARNNRFRIFSIPFEFNT